MPWPLEAGVWGKAGWLLLQSHLEELLTLASVPSTFCLCPPKVLHSVCGVPASGCHHVCVSVCQPRDVRACMYVHAHTCMSLFLAPPFWVRMPLWLLVLFPAASVPQPERRRCSQTTMRLFCRASAVLTLGPPASFPVSEESASGLPGIDSWDSSARVRRRLASESPRAFL